jgi:hypothetical protein
VLLNRYTNLSHQPKRHRIRQIGYIEIQMLPDFKNIDYLQNGSRMQQQGWKILTDTNALVNLKAFDAILTGTLPLNLYLPTSDLDIICYAEDLTQFEKYIAQAFGMYTGFESCVKNIRETPSAIGRFHHHDFLFEIFAQPVPVHNQYAYRHLRVEYFLLEEHGEPLRQQVLHLKQAGLKTEPAFAKALNLEGDPYEALLTYEDRIPNDYK